MSPFTETRAPDVDLGDDLLDETGISLEPFEIDIVKSSAQNASTSAAASLGLMLAKISEQDMSSAFTVRNRSW